MLVRAYWVYSSCRTRHMYAILFNARKEKPKIHNEEKQDEKIIISSDERNCHDIYHTDHCSSPWYVHHDSSNPSMMEANPVTKYVGRKFCPRFFPWFEISVRTGLVSVLSFASAHVCRFWQMWWKNISSRFWVMLPRLLNDFFPMCWSDRAWGFFPRHNADHAGTISQPHRTDEIPQPTAILPSVSVHFTYYTLY